MPSTTLSVEDESTPPVLGAPCLVRAFRCDRPLEAGERIDLDGVDVLHLGRGHEPAELRDGAAITVRIADERMSTTHARLVRNGAAFTLEDAGSKNGTHCNGQPCTSRELADGDVIEAGHTFFVFRSRAPRGLGKRPAVFGGDLLGETPLVTFVAALSKQLDTLVRVAPSQMPVIVLGETGTGKEVIARATHALSRRTGAFVAVNCGAIPANLVESELFGARKGAFSGALVDRSGLVRAADGGTLFLDEIAELPLPAQVALLRVLQEQEVMAIGDPKPIKVDVRVIAATHRPLERLVDTEKFRADLYARLAGFTIRLPALRERREDLGLLVASLLRKHGASAERLHFSRRAGRLLFGLPFPGNIRELEKALGFAITIAGSSATTELDVPHFPDELQAGGRRATSSPPIDDEPEPVLASSVDAERKAQLVELLTLYKGRISEVARAMGKARMQIHRWIQRYELDLESYRKL